MYNYQENEDWNFDLDRGTKAEKPALDLAVKLGMISSWQPATNNQNIKMHTDAWAIKNGVQFGVDVKTYDVDPAEVFKQKYWTAGPVCTFELPVDLKSCSFSGSGPGMVLYHYQYLNELVNSPENIEEIRQTYSNFDLQPLHWFNRDFLKYLTDGKGWELHKHHYHIIKRPNRVGKGMIIVMPLECAKDLEQEWIEWGRPITIKVDSERRQHMPCNFEIHDLLNKNINLCDAAIKEIKIFDWDTLPNFNNCLFDACVFREQTSYKKQKITDCDFVNDTIVELNQAVIKNCNFSETMVLKIENGKLENVVFDNCYLSSTKILNTKLQNVKFINGCSLKAGDFSDCVFENVNFSNANYRDAIFPSNALPWLILSDMWPELKDTVTIV